MLHEVVTSEKVPFTYRVAGLGSRSLAAFIDVFIFAVVTIAGLVFASVFEAARAGLGTGIAAVWLFALMCSYFVLSEWLWLGQTPGKKLLGIRVIQWEGTNITFGQSALRNLLRIVDILPAFYGVGFLAAVCNREHRRLGDLAANTLVVHVEINPPPLPRYVTPDAETEKETRLLLQRTLDQLSKEQKQTILGLCQRRDQLRIRVRTRLFGAIANWFKNEKDLQPGPFESDEKFVSRLAAELDRAKK